MTRVRGVSILIALALVVATGWPAAADDDRPKDRPLRVEVHRRGELFCPARTLVFEHRIVVPAGRCFVVSVLREPRGTFLAFLDPGVTLPANGVVVLTSPHGRKIRERIVFLVPIATTAVLVPVNTIVLVPIRVEDFDSRVTIVVLERAVPRAAVVFTIRL